MLEIMILVVKLASFLVWSQFSANNTLFSVITFQYLYTFYSMIFNSKHLSKNIEWSWILLPLKWICIHVLLQCLYCYICLLSSWMHVVIGWHLSVLEMFIPWKVFFLWLKELSWNISLWIQWVLTTFLLLLFAISEDKKFINH